MASRLPRRAVTASLLALSSLQQAQRAASEHVASLAPVRAHSLQHRRLPTLRRHGRTSCSTTQVRTHPLPHLQAASQRRIGACLRVPLTLRAHCNTCKRPPSPHERTSASQIVLGAAWQQRRGGCTFRQICSTAKQPGRACLSRKPWDRLQARQHRIEGVGTLGIRRTRAGDTNNFFVFSSSIGKP